MQISKINSANFKGLWEIKTVGQKNIKDDLGDGYAVFYEDAIYRPWADETPEQIAKEMAKEKEGEVWEHVEKDYDQYYPYSARVTHKVIQGETLGVTKAEFEAMQELVRNAQENAKRHDPGYGKSEGWEKSKYSGDKYLETYGAGRKVVTIKEIEE